MIFSPPLSPSGFCRDKFALSFGPFQPRSAATIPIHLVAIDRPPPPSADAPDPSPGGNWRCLSSGGASVKVLLPTTFAQRHLSVSRTFLENTFELNQIIYFILQTRICGPRPRGDFPGRAGDRRGEGVRRRRRRTGLRVHPHQARRMVSTTRFPQYFPSFFLDRAPLSCVCPFSSPTLR